MKLLVWTSSYGPALGGGPVLVQLLAEALARRGHDLRVIVDDTRCAALHEDMVNSVRVMRLPLRRALGGERAILQQVLGTVSKVRSSFAADVDFVFSTSASCIVREATQRQHRTPLVVGLHDFWPPESLALETALGRNLRRADWVTGCSASVITAVRQQLPELASRSSAIINALPEPDLTQALPQAPPMTLAFLGRLVRKKGVVELLSAVARLIPAFPALQLRVGGAGEDAAALRDQVDAMALAPHVSFHGAIARDKVHRFLAESAVTVIPSLIEPFGLVAVEAAQAARPVVASDVGGLREVIADGVTGLLVPPGEVTALAGAIATLLNDPARAAAMGIAARQHVLSQFPWTAYVDAHEALFRRLAAVP